MNNLTFDQPKDIDSKVDLENLLGEFVSLSENSEGAYDTRAQILAWVQRENVIGIRVIINEEILPDNVILIIVGGTPPASLTLTLENILAVTPFKV